MTAQRINVTLPEDLVTLLDAHVGAEGIARSTYVAASLRRALVADALAAIAEHNGGRLPYAVELEGIEDAA